MTSTSSLVSGPSYEKGPAKTARNFFIRRTWLPVTAAPLRPAWRRLPTLPPMYALSPEKITPNDATKPFARFERKNSGKCGRTAFLAYFILLQEVLGCQEPQSWLIPGSSNCAEFLPFHPLNQLKCIDFAQLEDLGITRGHFLG